jgi:hypothetical protein
MDTDSFHQRKRSYGVYVHARLRGYKVDRKENLNQRITAREWILSNFQNYSKRASCIQACATAVGISIRNARKAMIGVEKSGKLAAPWVCPVGDKPHGIKNDKDGFAQFDLIAKVPHTPEDLIEMCNLDTDIWELKRGRVGFWGNSENPNYQTRVEFTRLISEGGERFLHKIREEMKNFSPIYPQLVYSPTSEEYMLEIDLFDLHIGSVSSTYDITIASNRFINSVSRILNWYHNVPITKIIFPIGNDLMNSDVFSNSTTKGTRMEDEANTPRNTYRVAFDTLVQALELCRVVAPVTAIGIEGNHDKNSTFVLLHALEAYFARCEEVTIINTGSPLHFVSWGNNLLGFCHSHGLKVSELPLIMSVESPPEAWVASASGVRQWRIGHKHHKNSTDTLIKSLETEDDMHGIRVSMCAALTDRSFWAQNHGCRSLKECQSCLWSKTEGDVSYYSFKYGDGKV